MNKNNEYTKSRIAIALSYDPEEEAPKVIATGRGYLANRIMEKAKESDIPMHQDTELASHLSKIELGSFVPPELYEVVADVLTFVDHMDRIKGKLGL